MPNNMCVRDLGTKRQWQKPQPPDPELINQWHFINWRFVRGIQTGYRVWGVYSTPLGKSSSYKSHIHVLMYMRHNKDCIIYITYKRQRLRMLNVIEYSGTKRVG